MLSPLNVEAQASKRSRTAATAAGAAPADGEAACIPFVVSMEGGESEKVMSKNQLD